MLTFAVGLLILSFAVALLGIMLDEIYPWGEKVVAVATIMLCVSLTCLAGCVFYYSIHV
nr:MAG TPA: hypothetical protein [Caudoviricetes sp.]